MIHFARDIICPFFGVISLSHPYSMCMKFSTIFKIDIANIYMKFLDDIKNEIQSALISFENNFFYLFTHTV